MKERTQGKNHRVLYVDDDSDFAEVVAERLEDERPKLEIHVETSPMEGIERLEEVGYDCIVSDYDMLGIDGIEFLRMVRGNHPDVPFILYTGKGSEDVASEAISAGATDYIRKKGVDSSYLLLANRVEKAAERYSSQTALGRVRRGLSDFLGKPVYSGDEGFSVEKVLSSIFEQSPTGVVLTDNTQDDNPLIYANEKFLSLTGYSEEEVLGQNCGFLQGEETDPEKVAAMREAVDSGGSVTVELRNYRKDGPEFWNRVTISPLQDDTGEVNYFLGFQEDITDRKEHERELERHEAFIENAHDMITHMDASGEILYQSPSVERILGYEQEELFGENAFEYIHPDDRESVMEDFASLVSRSGSGDAVEWTKFRFRRKDGSYVWIEAVGADQTNTEFGGYVVNSRDVTERVEREKELEREKERLERFASVVSHDLRNPLSILSGYLNRAEETGNPEYFETCRNAIDRMERLIDDLLSLAREMDETEPEVVELAETAKECWRNTDTRNADLYVESGMRIMADKGQLQQLLENLFSNSVAHGSPSSGSQTRQDSVENGGDGLSVTVSKLDDGEGFRVEDDGEGIPEDERDDIFEFGYTNSEDGTGLGLYIVKQVAEAHGWEASVTEGEEGGAAFEFRDVEPALSESSQLSS